MSVEIRGSTIGIVGNSIQEFERPVAPSEIRDSHLAILARKSKERKQFAIDNEYDNTDITILQPLRSVTVTKTENRFGNEVSVEVNVDEDLKKEFEYLSRTRVLETNTPKTKVLQDLVDRMLEGKNIPTRVVVMNKNEAPDAFCTAEGTLFISQSLINTLDCVDEITAVLAHEVEHLVNKTFEYVYGSHNFHKNGTGWLHEGMSDQFTPSLLEKLDLNAVAFTSAIKKITGGKRGMDIEHQGGNIRAAQIVAHILARNYRTSNKPHTPKSEQLDGQAVPSNWEIFNHRYDFRERGYEKPVDMEEMRRLLSNLHPQDFEYIYKNQLPAYYSADSKENAVEREVLYAANDLIFTRLRKEGFSDSEITTFLVSSTGRNGGNNRLNLYFLKNSEQVEKIAESLEGIDADKKMDKMAILIFGHHINQSSFHYSEDYRHSLLTLVHREFYIEGIEKPELGIPINEDVLINFASAIYRLYPRESIVSARDEVTEMFLDYVGRVFLGVPEQEGLRVDEVQIRNFFEKIKVAGIDVNTREIDYYIDEKKKVNTIVGNFNISVENQQIVKDVFCEVFDYHPVVEKNVLTFETIDKFIEDLNTELASGSYQSQTRGVLSDIMDTMWGYFEEQRVTDPERLKFIEYLDEKILQLKFTAHYSINDLLLRGINFQRTETLSSENEEKNDKFMKFNLRSFIGLNLFDNDGEEFYKYMEKIMSTSGIDIQSLNRDQLLNLCQGFMIINNRILANREFLIYGQQTYEYTYLTPSREGDKKFVTDYERFFNLPFLKYLIDQKSSLGFSTIKDLNEFIVRSQGNSLIIRKGKANLYYDDFSSLFFGRLIRENFLEILQRGISEKDFPDLFAFISNYYPDGVIKNQFLNEIHKQYLHSPDISLDEKIDYLLRFYDSIGLEGTMILGEQIEDLETFERFREKLGGKLDQYSKGSSKAITTLAFSDFLTSFLASNYYNVFRTSQNSGKDRKDLSTEFAKIWFESYFGFAESLRNIIYDKARGKFTFGDKGRIFFQTISDSIISLKNLPSLKRFAIAQKLLLDDHGALSSEHDRKMLGEILVSSLRFQKGFISEAIRSVCRRGEADWVAFPASRMLAPLLFRNLDVNAIDYSKVEKISIQERKRETYEYVTLGSVLPNQDMVRIAGSNSRDIILFGSDYKQHPNSAIARLADESDSQYYSINDVLIKLLVDRPDIGKTEQASTEIDPALESVISGIEASGALGVRALQLVTQMMHFAPNIEARLSKTLDTNPGLNKFLFWENLEKLASEDPETAEFLSKVKLGNYLGGGSLYTTFAATFTENGHSEEIVLKMLNPSAERVVDEGYKLADGVLKEVGMSKGRSRSDREFAKIGLTLIDLSKQWCKDDINDPRFIEDDDRFSQVINSFNQIFGREVFYKPTRRFNIKELKSETRANGQTVNHFLQDNNVSGEEKTEATKLMGRFLAHQLQHAPKVIEQGKTYRLIHSDPHIGNYVIDSQDGQPKLAVIDRHMYLRLEEQDVRVLEKLIVSGNDNDFVYSFLDRVLDINGVGDAQRRNITNQVFGKLRIEYIKQRIRGKVDRLSLMRTMLSSLSESKFFKQSDNGPKEEQVDVPLNLRLMIRNIGAFQELGRRYGVDFEVLYREAA